MVPPHLPIRPDARGIKVHSETPVIFKLTSKNLLHRAIFISNIKANVYEF
jgi:hypothetical protein